eukprot:CAMPEP_0175115314 /NCGR_PEP_ID=MMETSP0086_2-20121207/17484_1 /TAXON_ID=136419 /ORGANISM="Unknown Unknown, Strain D1" /LENGTH=660 /DNA_ID=CAMNT_0016395343 /DNA_START=57 /DNA_END=2039 /DNA_ORIENTATION=-
MYSSKSEPALPTKTDAKGRRFRPGAGVVLNSLGSSDRDKDKGSRSNKRSSPPSQDRDSPQEKQGDRDREREELATADTADTTDTTNTAEDTAQMGAIAAAAQAAASLDSQMGAIAAAQAAASLTVRAVVIGMNGIGGSRGQKAQKRGAETPSNAEIGEGTAGEIHLVLSTEAGTPTALGVRCTTPWSRCTLTQPSLVADTHLTLDTECRLGTRQCPTLPRICTRTTAVLVTEEQAMESGVEDLTESGTTKMRRKGWIATEVGGVAEREVEGGDPLPEKKAAWRPPPRKKAASSLRSEGKATSKDSAGKIVSFQETYEQHQNEVKTRAVKLIQRWFRSPKQQHRRFMQFVKQRDMANVILTELIDEFLATDFIPDLLIHILTTKGDEYVWRNEELAALHSTAADLINEVVAAQAKSVVEGVISDMVDSYLGALRANPGREASRNLITEIRDSIIDECIEDSAPELVKEAINEMADAYLVDNEAHSILWSLLGPHIETVCNEARVGVLMDRALDQMIEIELKESVPEIVVEAIKEVNESMMQDRLAKDNELLMAASEHVVDALLMQYACWYVSDRGEVASIVTSLNNYMDAIIADSLMRNFAASLQNHQAVASSKVHNRIHQDISAPPIFDALMDMVLEEVEDAEDEEHDLELHYSEIDLIF